MRKGLRLWFDLFIKDINKGCLSTCSFHGSAFHWDKIFTMLLFSTSTIKWNHCWGRKLTIIECL